MAVLVAFCRAGFASLLAEALRILQDASVVLVNADLTSDGVANSGGTVCTDDLDDI